MGGPKDDRIISLRKDDAFGIALSANDDMPHDFPLRPQPRLKVIGVIAVALQLNPGHATFNRRPGDGGGNSEQNPGIQRLGDEVIGPEPDGFASIGPDDRIGDIFACAWHDADAELLTRGSEVNPQRRVKRPPLPDGRATPTRQGQLPEMGRPEEA